MVVSEAVVDVMEAGNLAEFQQAVLDSQRPLLLGAIWRRRVALATVALLLSLLLSVAELSLAYFYLAVATQVTFGVLTLLVPLVVAPLLQMVYHRYSRGAALDYPNQCIAFLEYVPVFPAYHMVLFYRTVTKLFDEQDVYCRERHYIALSTSSNLHATLHAAPQLFLQIVVCLLRVGDPGGGEIIYAIGRVSYEAESVPWNYVMAVVTSSLCLLFGGVCHWKRW